MTEKIGIKETLDAVDAGVALGNGIGKALEDGKFGVSDLAYFGGAVMSIPSAIVGIGEVPAELADLDEAEVSEIIARVDDRLNVGGEKAKEIAVDALILMNQIHGFARKHFISPK